MVRIFIRPLTMIQFEIVTYISNNFQSVHYSEPLEKCRIIEILIFLIFRVSMISMSLNGTHQTDKHISRSDIYFLKLNTIHKCFLDPYI